MKLVIYPNKIASLVKEGGKLVLKKSAEKELEKLLRLEQTISEAILSVKEQIATAGLAIDSGFRGVIGERVRAIYRLYGERYGYDKSKFDQARPFLKRITFYKVDAEAVDKHLAETGEMPDGIYLRPRSPTLSLKLHED